MLLNSIVFFIRNTFIRNSRLKNAEIEWKTLKLKKNKELVRN